MKPSKKEPQYTYTEEEVALKSPLAKEFYNSRKEGNLAIQEAGNSFTNRYFNLDHNTYLNGELDCKTKELMGLVASMALRCDDCIFYHIIQSYRLKASKKELEESMNIALMVGGSIVIPHSRRAYMILNELFGE